MAGLMVLDSTTTWLALHHAVFAGEGNPLMAAVMVRLGLVGTCVVKALVGTVVAAGVLHFTVKASRRRDTGYWLLWLTTGALVVGMALVVASNVRYIGA